MHPTWTLIIVVVLAALIVFGGAPSAFSRPFDGWPAQHPFRKHILIGVVVVVLALVITQWLRS